MALAVGARLGPYEVLSPIGAGGMGEVYKARDTRLERIVAIKIIASDAASDANARARFDREAKAVAALTHPNICTLHDVGHQDAIDYIVMEYVEGETLARRLRRGPLSLADSLGCAAQIADALDKAHRSGIVHRDLKPANVMVTPEGRAKVMDFGLATRIALPGGDPASLATRTVAGPVAGTLTYMSPEQLRGLPVDSRSDVFAFGIVLCEMLTGANPFAQPSAISTIDAILNAPEPAPASYPKQTPPRLVDVVSRCLAKEPERRYQSIRDVQLELNAIAAGGASARMPAIRRRPRWLVAAIAGAILVGAVAGARQWRVPLPFSQRAFAFNERDWILIADFDNLTGDQVFDRSLRTALEAGISQSQFVNVFPPSRVDAALKRIPGARVDRLDDALALDVAVREGVRAVLACSIAQVGDVYSLTARVVNPQSRGAVLTESVQARGKGEVLPALDRLAGSVRRRLGESLGGIEGQSVPLPKATTSSLEALKLYADSLAAHESEPGDELLRQAIALDPDFALARAELGRRYYLKSKRTERLRGEEQFVRALGLLDRLTTRERLWITAVAEDSRGRRETAVDAYKSYLAQYPDDAGGWFRLGWTQMAGLGQREPALAAFKRVLVINPADPSAQVNLATCYSALHQAREAVDEYRKAFTLRPEFLKGDFINHEYGFTLVELGDTTRAADTFRTMIADPDRSKQARGYRSLALLEMYRGRYADAIDGLRKAIALNRADTAVVSEFRNRLFLTQALEAKGMTGAAASELAAAEAIVGRTSLGPEWLRRLATMRARRGRVPEAKRLLARMQRSVDNATTDSSANRNTSRDQADLDVVRGGIALAERRPADAVKLFESARVIEPRLVDALDSLAAALAAAGQLDDAAKRYEDLLAELPLGDEGQESWLRAHVHVGAIYERLGRSNLAGERYQRLLTIWKDADADLVILRQAKARLAALKGKRE